MLLKDFSLNFYIPDSFQMDSKINSLQNCFLLFSNFMLNQVFIKLWIKLDNSIKKILKWKSKGASYASFQTVPHCHSFVLLCYHVNLLHFNSENMRINSNSTKWIPRDSKSMKVKVLSKPIRFTLKRT